MFSRISFASLRRSPDAHSHNSLLTGSNRRNGRSSSLKWSNDFSILCATASSSAWINWTRARATASTSSLFGSEVSSMDFVCVNAPVASSQSKMRTVMFPLSLSAVSMSTYQLDIQDPHQEFRSDESCAAITMTTVCFPPRSFTSARAAPRGYCPSWYLSICTEMAFL
eukprot:GEMP01050262.1.p1 GENE.GEMP01050262.1~~GEMP01050262.1.p1  ORF type:complete len:168 (-),score=29.20 GEMP01050262.1:412-915(-)